MDKRALSACFGLDSSPTSTVYLAPYLCILRFLYEYTLAATPLLKTPNTQRASTQKLIKTLHEQESEEVETDVRFNHCACGVFFFSLVRITCQPLTTYCLCVKLVCYVHSSRLEEHDTREDKVKAAPLSLSTQLPGLCKL